MTTKAEWRKYAIVLCIIFVIQSMYLGYVLINDALNLKYVDGLMARGL